MNTSRIRRNVVRLVVWIPQGALAAAFVLGGAAKLSGESAMVDMFDTVGAGQWLRYLVGALEMTGAVGLLVPRWAGLAAFGLVGLMVGAAVTNVAVLDEAPWLPLGFLVVAAVVARIRWPQTRILFARLRAAF